MNDDITTALKVLAAAGGFALFVWIGVVMVKFAKRGSGGMRALLSIGLIMIPWATIHDPCKDVAVETEDGRIRKGNRSGDPLDDDDEPPAA
jgi:hypothetical protein